MLPRSTPMISSDRGVFINGGEFHQHNYHGQTLPGNEAPFDILKGAVASNALHDSGASFDKPKCHPRTRVKIREIIMHWILGEDKDGWQKAGKQFMWLSGAAGCGKSAIAQSTIEVCIGRGIRLASFFFSRSDSTRNHAGSLVATLAYQLYCAFPGTELRKDILSTIAEEPLIFKKTLQQQFTALILKPLTNHLSKPQSTQQPVPFLIVIDGLDECIDRSAQKAILTGVAKCMRTSNSCFPIFIASRPEHDIKLSFGTKLLQDIHTRLSLDLADDEYNADSDIRLYLVDRFAEIKDDFDNRATGRNLAHDWPGDEVIEMLVKKSSRQFIYAATVIRYVESTRHRPDHRLDVVLNLRPVNGDHPFAELDALYATILESAIDIEKVLLVLSLPSMNFDVSCSMIEKLLSYDEGDVETLFCDLGALVQVYKKYDQRLLRFLHASFREYLYDAARSKQFYINMDYQTIKHVIHALQYLASCCSSFLNFTQSTAAIAVYILRNIPYRSGQDRISQITISHELRQSMLSFPLEKFLAPRSTSTLTYWPVLRDFVTPFLQLLEAMVLTDPTSSHIQDHQLGILRSILLPQIQQYFNDDRPALVLVLFYHLASHRFVPILQRQYSAKKYSPDKRYSTPFYPAPDFDAGDILSLSCPWMGWGIPRRDNIYHDFVRQLLRDPGRPTKYALGPVMYEKAALHCFKELPN
ncbi:hypothetical protein D9613_006361 [Agrocybe pediades]|uniref:Nephrocystin 3-like N-terminal domain-containing protein n=1 Tax=Agrocybe pediades TaxID=84607 RepID=A0A8H4QTU4_9AGAR|nr:hypothetical protein D9613_006361 [Agrocybe pediades]